MRMIRGTCMHSLAYSLERIRRGWLHLRCRWTIYHDPLHPTTTSKVTPPVPVSIYVSDPRRTILPLTKALAMARPRSQQGNANVLSFNLIEVLDDWHQDQGTSSFRAVVTLGFGTSRPERIPWTRVKTPKLQTRRRPERPSICTFLEDAGWDERTQRQ